MRKSPKEWAIKPTGNVSEAQKKKKTASNVRRRLLHLSPTQPKIEGRKNIATRKKKGRASAASQRTLIESPRLGDERSAHPTNVGGQSEDDAAAGTKRRPSAVLGGRRRPAHGRREKKERRDLEEREKRMRCGLDAQHGAVQCSARRPLPSYTQQPAVAGEAVRRERPRAEEQLERKVKWGSVRHGMVWIGFPKDNARIHSIEVKQNKGEEKKEVSSANENASDERPVRPVVSPPRLYARGHGENARLATVARTALPSALPQTASSAMPPRRKPRNEGTPLAHAPSFPTRGHAIAPKIENKNPAPTSSPRDALVPVLENVVDGVDAGEGLRDELVGGDGEAAGGAVVLVGRRAHFDRPFAVVSRLGRFAGGSYRGNRGVAQGCFRR
ncbi:hypothetical protein C8F04DRAFT_1190767 [Mycena alexandri]|uniref:Uncharacterized protein n=1 Tax=Mycena alexandri TaxID=1745969 RepID=A0AAD6WVD8_9AGAR|nr:hypothetical protein C8F04DRAFT_1190767 [Mycena alexandri]